MKVSSAFDSQLMREFPLSVSFWSKFIIRTTISPGPTLLRSHNTNCIAYCFHIIQHLFCLVKINVNLLFYICIQNHKQMVKEQWYFYRMLKIEVRSSILQNLEWAFRFWKRSPICPYRLHTNVQLDVTAFISSSTI